LAPTWSTSCPDWEQRIVEKRPLIPFGPLFPERAEEALEIFKGLRAVDVAGSPCMGDICRDWIYEFVAAVFGAYDHPNNRRLISEFLLSVSKKNGKSTLAAGIMLTALILNWRNSAGFSIIAPTIEVANNSFFPARDMVNADPALKALMHVQNHYRTITNRKREAQLKVLAADSDSVSGSKATAILVDELWLFGKKANAESILLEATGGLAARPEGFTISLTTQSDEPPAGVWDKKLKYARGVRDGRVKDPSFLPVLYEWPEKMLKQGAPKDEAFWYITNPNLGASVDPNFIRRELGKAEEGGEESVQAILAKHLNVEIGQRLRSNRWAGADDWEDRATGGLTLEALLERCEVIELGIDGGGRDDLLGLSAIGREKQTGNWLHWAHAWCDPVALERRKSIAPELQGFADDGDLTIVPTGEDVEQLADIVLQVHDSGLLDRIGVDPVGIGSVVDALSERGIDTAKQIVAVSQGWRLNGAIKTLERKLADGTFFHGGARLMAWSVGNAKVEVRGNAVSITKYASGVGKIDPLMATFDAVTLMALNPAARGSFDDFLADPIIA
jgi:phage terminase large subunit-like protein